MGGEIKQVSASARGFCCSSTEHWLHGRRTGTCHVQEMVDSIPQQGADCRAGAASQKPRWLHAAPLTE